MDRKQDGPQYAARDQYHRTSKDRKAQPWIRTSSPVHLTDKVEGIIDQRLQEMNDEFDTGIFDKTLKYQHDDDTVMNIEEENEEENNKSFTYIMNYMFKRIYI
ncbi:unnamed protein product [Gordionus sp. m RMFG-2023]